MEKFIKILYWIATIGFCVIMLFSAQMYFTKTEIVKGFMKSFSYPTYIVIPLGICKVLGVITILTNFNAKLKEWTYSAFFFEILLAFFAHYMNGDGQQSGAILAMVLLLTSYFSSAKARPNNVKIYE